MNKNLITFILSLVTLTPIIYLFKIMNYDLGYMGTYPLLLPLIILIVSLVRKNNILTLRKWVCARSATLQEITIS